MKIRSIDLSKIQALLILKYLCSAIIIVFTALLISAQQGDVFYFGWIMEIIFVSFSIISIVLIKMPNEKYQPLIVILTTVSYFAATIMFGVFIGSLFPT